MQYIPTATVSRGSCGYKVFWVENARGENFVRRTA
jgi:hypothetical protein